MLLNFACKDLYTAINNELRIYFVDVGQGDSTVIKTPKGKNVIIDGGEENTVLLPYLLDRRINKIDYLIVSHFDSDHAGGCAQILENLTVSNLVISKQIEKTDLYNQIMLVAMKKKINIIVVKAGDKLNIDGMQLIFLHPQEELIPENGMNNNSIVFKLQYNEFSMLFTGDIEEVAEKELIKIYGNNLKSNILKVAHHGSKTSSIEEFLKQVNPQIAVIGVGRENKFGHPSSSTIENLKNINCNIYRTDRNGEIIIKINKSIKIKTYF